MNLKAKSNTILGSLISIVCVVYQSLYRVVPANGDVLLGLPIAKEQAHPGLYSSYDLLVSSGIRGPFHLYKYLGGMLYSNRANVDVIWEILFLVFLFLTFLLVWHLSMEITGNTLSSALVLAVIAVAHPLRGTLHAAAVPIQSFITASAAMPFALGAIFLIFRKRALWAMALASFVFNIHPYVGLLTASAIAVVIFFERGRSLRVRLGVVLAGGALAIPNIIYILGHMSTNFVGTNSDFYTQFRLYAMHVFVEDHWREGYGWFFTNLGGAVLFSRYIDGWKRRIVLFMFAWWFVLMGAYALNAYVTTIPSLLLTFLFRATYFIKPLVLIFIVHGLHMWRKALRQDDNVHSWWQPWEYSFAVGILFLSSILPMASAVLADILALIAYGMLAILFTGIGRFHKRMLVSTMPMGVVLLCSYALSYFIRPSPISLLIENSIVGVVVIFGLYMIFALRKVAPLPFPDEKDAKIQAIPRNVVLAALSILLVHHLIISLKDRQKPFVPDIQAIKERIFIQRDFGKTADLMEWVRNSTPQASLFAIPPEVDTELGAFRLNAERGVFITLDEVNQLAFDASIYHEAHRRITRLGVVVSDRRKFDTHGYYELTRANLRALSHEEHVDYAIFAREQLHGELATLPRAFSGHRYVVINLHEIAG